MSDAPVPPGAPEIFADAAHALSAMARSIADHGRIVAPPELGPIADRLLRSYAAEHDVVAIESLAPDHAGSLVRRGTPFEPAAAGPPIPVELVSVGDHLLAAADTVASAADGARDLRLFVLHRTLAAMPSRSATGRFLAPLIEALTSAIALGVPSERPEAFVAMLRGCGRFLVDSGSDTNLDGLVRRRDAIAVSLGMVRATARIAAPSAPEQPIEPVSQGSADLDLPIVDIASLTISDDDDLDVVPIESLAPDIVHRTPRIPAEAPGTPTRLERAYSARRDIERRGTDETATLSGLIAAEIVPVASLLYRGASALHRAEEVRDTLRQLLADAAVPLDRVRPHLDELLDLVPLARDAA